MPIRTFRLFDFEVLNKKDEHDFEECEGDARKFYIKMFGMDENGKTYCIFLKDFAPFFYVKVPNSWTKRQVLLFKYWLRDQPLNNHVFLSDSIVSCKLVTKKDLYGFDNNKEVFPLSSEDEIPPSWRLGA